MQRGLLHRRLKIAIPFSGVSSTDRILFAKTVAMMLRSGITITESLATAEGSSSGRFKRILKGVTKSIESGQSFSGALAAYPEVFSSFFINTVKVGESSGTLAENLESVALQLEKEQILISKIKGASLYPIVVLSAALVLGLVMAFFVLPKFIPLLESLRIDLPLSTRILIGVSHFIGENSIALAAIIVIVIVSFSILLKQTFIQPFSHWLFLHIPFIRKMIRYANLSRFSRTLGMLTKSGVNIDEALVITVDTTKNYYYKRSLRLVSERIGKGTQLSAGLGANEALFPALVTRMVRAGEESGNLSETLLYLADFYERELDNSAKNLPTILEPLLLLVLGLMVSFLALSIMSPIFNATGSLGR